MTKPMRLRLTEELRRSKPSVFPPNQWSQGSQFAHKMRMEGWRMAVRGVLKAAHRDSGPFKKFDTKKFLEACGYDLPLHKRKKHDPRTATSSGR